MYYYSKHEVSETAHIVMVLQEIIQLFKPNQAIKRFNFLIEIAATGRRVFIVSNKVEILKQASSSANIAAITAANLVQDNQIREQWKIEQNLIDKKQESLKARNINWEFWYIVNGSQN